MLLRKPQNYYRRFREGPSCFQYEYNRFEKNIDRFINRGIRFGNPQVVITGDPVDISIVDTQLQSDYEYVYRNQCGRAAKISSSLDFPQFLFRGDPCSEVGHKKGPFLCPTSGQRSPLRTSGLWSRPPRWSRKSWRASHNFENVMLNFQASWFSHDNFVHTYCKFYR